MRISDWSSDVFSADLLEGIGPRAYRFAELGLRHREDALDAVLEAMMRMLGYRDRPAAEWTPLFWRILRTRVVDAQRRRMLRLHWRSAERRVGNESVRTCRTRW